MAQQTAVEWIVNKIYMVIPNEERNFLEGLREQAKAMEKEQIIKAVYDGMGTNFDPNMGRAEQYYNETYTQGNE